MKNPNPPILRTARIERLDEKGKGIGLTDTGGTLTIPYSIPGEVVEAEKLRRKEARIQQILQSSPHRVQPLCSHFTACGGCAWQHIAYPQQLKIKQAAIRERFRECEIPLDISEIPTIPSPPWEYRNRMDFVWWPGGKFGLRRRDQWHAIVNLDECRLIPADLMKIALAIHHRAMELELPIRDQRYRIRGLRYLVIRRGINTGEIMLSFVSDPMEIPPQLWMDLNESGNSQNHPRIVSINQLINDNLERDISDGVPVPLSGETHYQEKIRNHRFRVGPKSFFQPNPAVAECMVNSVREYLQNHPQSQRRLLDLYCGIGLFTILLSDLVESACGVENSSESIRLAQQNAEGIPVEFLLEDCAKLPAEFYSRFNTLLIDPPRIGLPPQVIQTVLEQDFQEIIYVSCNPKRGIQDLAAFISRYRLEAVQLFDQFPQTPHVEMIAYLQR